jgi:hypothetical protein
MEGVRRQREDIEPLIDRWKGRPPEEFEDGESPKGRQVQLDILGEPGQVGNDEDMLFLVAPEKGQHTSVVGVEKL